MRWRTRSSWKNFKLVEAHLRNGKSAADLTEAFGLTRGVTGYVYHTVPVAIFCWLSSPSDYRRAVEEVILLGGDADTTAAIVGALVGAGVGEAGIPDEWLNGVCEWPRSVCWMQRLGNALAQHVRDQRGSASRAVPLCWPLIPVRNAIFLAIVLLHGFRRLLPPYA